MRFFVACLTIAVIGLAASARAASPVTNDAWDVSHGAVILSNSSFDHDVGQGYDARDVFGGNFTAYLPERGRVVFDDASPINTIDFIEWRTSSPVSIGSFNLFYMDDGVPLVRSLGHFALYERKSAADPWVSLYSANTPLSGPMISGTVSAFAAKDFRAEFTRANNLGGYTGERIVELDGFAVPEPCTASLSLLAAMAFSLYRRWM